MKFESKCVVKTNIYALIPAYLMQDISLQKSEVNRKRVNPKKKIQYKNRPFPWQITLTNSSMLRGMYGHF